MDVEPISGTTLDFIRLGQKRERREKRSEKCKERREKRGEGREKIEKNVEASNL